MFASCCQEWKSGKHARFGNVRPYENDPPPPPPGSELDPSSFPLKLVRLEYDVNPSKKGWDRFKISIPPAIRSRYIDDAIYGPEWKALLLDFDEKYLTLCFDQESNQAS